MLSATLENLLNRGLPRSPRARALVAQLEGRSVAADIRALARLRVASNGLTLKVTMDGEPADATISAGPLGMLALFGPAPEAAIQRGDVAIAGDAEVAQQFRELGALLRPDFEEELSLLLGDVPAHQLGRLARSGVSWGAKAATTTLTNFAEYLGHERGHLVPRNEGEQFLRGVDAVRDGVERAAARIELLARRRRAP